MSGLTEARNELEHYVLALGNTRDDVQEEIALSFVRDGQEQHDYEKRVQLLEVAKHITMGRAALDRAINGIDLCIAVDQCVADHAEPSSQ